MPSDRSFVGFGFGPIQAGLMLREAVLSGNFSSWSVLEIDAGLVEAVRAAKGTVSINIAEKSGVVPFRMENIEMLNPRDAADGPRIRQALEKADELATALPSVEAYSSIVGLLSKSAGKRPQVLYACENNNDAATILTRKLEELDSSIRERSFQVVDTVIGKMSGVLRDPALIASQGLKSITPEVQRAFLVESFNRIQIQKIVIPGFRRGLDIFEEVEDLQPFEEAKLFGHNAVHALLGYLAQLKGLREMSELERHPELLDMARLAFFDEIGPALRDRHARTNHPLFTSEGYRAYAEDLLERMLNPHLCDQVERVCRDPARKLAPGDRLIGSMSMVIRSGREPKHLALGAAAALKAMLPASVERREPGPEALSAKLDELWGRERPELLSECQEAIVRAYPELRSIAPALREP